MGQQQLLLIVLGAIIVGISVRIGFRIVDAQYTQQNRDQMTLQMQNIYANAEQYATKSARQAGGGGAYTGFVLSKTMLKNTSGTYTAVVTGAKALTIVGTGVVTGNNGASPVLVTCTVTNRKIASTVTNN